MVGGFVKAATGWHGEIIHCNAASAGVVSKMIRLLFSIFLGTALAVRSQPPESAETLANPQEKTNYGRPALIEASQLAEFDSLPDDRKKLISGAIAVAKESPWLPYCFGGSDPKEGGFDCSGAMYFVMQKVGLKPPRTSADQYLWLKENSRLVEITTEKGIDVEFVDSLPGGASCARR